MIQDQQKRYKYPRTPHLPWSPGNVHNDVVLINTELFDGKAVVVTEKVDGECTTLYNNYYHARSIDGNSHPSQSWLRQFHAGIQYQIPDEWRICGENLYAKHSIHYTALPSYFLGFSVWNESNICLSWEDTLNFFELLNIHCPPVLYEGLWSKEIIKDLKVDTSTQEGYVVRLSKEFHYSDFQKAVAKWVRLDHVQTDNHWKNQKIITNNLRKAP